MGFSGGGAGALLSHTHDSAITNDGGSLAANATQFGLSDQSLLVSDGTNIQELTAGSESNNLQISGGNLTWGVPAGGALEFIEEITLGADAASWTATLASPHVLADYDELICHAIVSQASSATVRMRYNGLSTGYRFATTECIEGTLQGNSGSNTAHISIQQQAGTEECDIIVRFCENPLDTSHQYGHWVSACASRSCGSGMFFCETAITEISSIYFAISAGNILQDSRIRLYRTVKS